MGTIHRAGCAAGHGNHRIFPDCAQNTQEVIWAEGAPVETFGGGNLDVFTNFVEDKVLYPNDPCLAIPLVAPNLKQQGERTRTLCRLECLHSIHVRGPFF